MNEEILQKKLYWLSKRIARAQREHDLFAPGDRVLIALSGGKDSAALLYALPVWARRSGLDLTIEAVHGEVAGAEPRRGPLQALADRAGVPLSFTSFEPDPAGPGPDGRTTHPCFRCARLRREALIRFAANGGWSKIALGHHLDDDAETVLMNLLYQGSPRGLAPSRAYFDGQVTIVRPLILAAERELAGAAALLEAPLSVCECPDGRPEPPDSARRRMKEMLAAMGRDSLQAKRHLQRVGLG